MDDEVLSIAAVWIVEVFLPGSNRWLPSIDAGWARGNWDAANEKMFQLAIANPETGYRVRRYVPAEAK